MSPTKIAYFNCTGIAPHIGCLGVTDSHMRILLRAGYNISSIFYTNETRHLLRVNQEETLQAILSSDVGKTLTEIDAVIINGEGTIHHGRGLDLLAIAQAAQQLGKPVYLVNCVFQEIEVYHDVLKKLADLNVRESRSSAYLNQLGIPNRIVADSIIEAKFHNQPNRNYTGKIICTDWQPARDNDVGIAIIEYLKLHSDKTIFLPMHHWSFMENQQWRYFVANLSTADCIITGRHHGVYAAGLAGVPFVAMPSNTHKVEGTLEDSDLPLPFCSNISELPVKVEYALSNQTLFKKFQNHLISQRPITVFDKLIADFPQSKKRTDAEVDKLVNNIFDELYQKCLTKEYDLKITEALGRIKNARKITKLSAQVNKLTAATLKNAL